MTNRTVSVTLALQASGYMQGMTAAAKATQETASQSEKLAAKRDGFNELGKSAVGFGAAALLATGMAVKAAMDWESAWTGVLKTNDGTIQQIGALEDSLRSMTKELPASHTEIAAVAEAAGQLGVQVDNVAAFTRTMIDLGEATNLTSTEAATQLARFMNVMGTAQGDVSNLGSAIVDLGNNYATTEAEIVAMAQRLSGAGVQIGLTEGEVLGLSTALSSVGIEAEAGGSAISKVMIDIASSVDKGGDRVAMFAEVAGVSASEFTRQWQTAPGAALALFVKGLADAESQGKSTFGILEDLGITEVRMRDALLRSAAASDQFAAAMDKGNEAFEANNALQDEAAKRYATTESQLRILNNRVNDAAINFGAVFLPAINDAAAALGGFADFLADMPDGLQDTVAIGVALAGGIALVGGAALLAVPQIASFKVALTTMGISAGSAARGIGLMGAAVGAAAALFAYFAGRQAEVTASTKELEDSLDSATGVSTAYTREIVARKLAEKGAFDAAKAAGITQKELTSAVLKGGDALDEVNRKITANNTLGNFFNTTASGAVAAGNAAAAINDLSGAVQTARSNFDDQTAAGQRAEVVLGDVSAAAADVTGNVEAMSNAISTFNEQQFRADDATFNFKQSLVDLEEAMGAEGFTGTLDLATQEGIDNNRMLRDIAAAANAAAAETLTLTGSQEESNAVLAEGRDRIAAVGEAFGLSGDALQQFIDRYIASPKEIAYEATLIGLDGVQARLDGFYTSWNGKRITINVDENGRESYGFGPGGMEANYRGGMYQGGVKAFYAGGFASGIYKGRQGGIHKFAESEMGVPWEAYISGRVQDRARNLDIWAQTGDRLGVSAPAMYASSPVTDSRQRSLDGMSISGRLEIGGDGLARLVDGRIHQADRDNQLAARPDRGW